MSGQIDPKQIWDQVEGMSAKELVRWARANRIRLADSTGCKRAGCIGCFDVSWNVFQQPRVSPLRCNSCPIIKRQAKETTTKGGMMATCADEFYIFKGRKWLVISGGDGTQPVKSGVLIESPEKLDELIESLQQARTTVWQRPND